MRHAFGFHWDAEVVCALVTSSCLPNGKCTDYELVYGSAGMLGVKKQSVWYEMERSFAIYVYVVVAYIAVSSPGLMAIPASTSCVR